MNSLVPEYLTDVHILKQNIPADIALTIQSAHNVDQFLQSNLLNRFKKRRDSFVDVWDGFRGLFIKSSSLCVLLLYIVLF
jgi:hypothetical protein